MDLTPAERLRAAAIIMRDALEKYDYEQAMARERDEPTGRGVRGT